MRNDLAIHVRWIGVADPGELALVGADHGGDDGHHAVLLGWCLDQHCGDGFQSLIMGQGQDAGIGGDFFLADLPAVFVVDVDLRGELRVATVCSHLE